MEATAYVRSLEAWVAHDALPCTLDRLETVDAAVDMLVAGLPASLELLGLGEALHGGEELLMLRNHLFARLVTAYGFRAIAIESSFPTDFDWLAVLNSVTYSRGGRPLPE